MKHLLKLSDLSGDEIIKLLDLADKLKSEKKNGADHSGLLKGKTLGMIFNKPSTRTRVSFETGIYQLGGAALFLNVGDIQLGRGESIKDSARVLGRYLDCVMIRTYSQSDVEEFAEYGGIPVINGLTDYCHPCQVLADLMTVREYKKRLKGLKLCYIGDGNNMANSLIVGGIKTGMTISIACPDGHAPDAEIVERAKTQGSLMLTNDIFKAADGADVLCTDVWSSMGREAEAESRAHVFKNYQLNEKLMKLANPDAMVLHCLPAHKGEEISEETFEKHAAEIFDEAENRLHIQKAVMLECMA